MARVQRLGSDKTGWATTVWVDPGGTTGWAVMSVRPVWLASTAAMPRPLHRSIEHWACGNFKGNENQMASEMLQLFDVWDDAALGIERFQVRQLAVEISPATITAKIEYGLWLQEKWAAEEEEREVGRGRYMFKQDPGMAKQFLTDDRQRAFGLWQPGPDHQRDAVKHCFTFLARAQQKPRLRFTAWPHLFKEDGSLLKRVPPTSKATARGRKA